MSAAVDHATDHAIQIEHLTKQFGRGTYARLALDGLDFSVPRGVVYGFLGINGAGKTTTIRILLDLIRPSGGVVKLLGKNPRTDRTVLRQVGALVEDAAFYPFLSGQENLELLAQMVNQRDAKRAIARQLERVGLSAQAKAKFNTYSTGMKQRLGVAAALLHDPELVILDEPTNGLDPVGIMDMRQLIRDLVDKDGKTVFLSSHLLGEVEQICDRVAIIDQGRLIREGTLNDLLAVRGDTVRIEVDQIDAALTALNETWHTHKLESDHAIEVHASRAQIPAIVARLVAANIQIFEVHQDRASLEAMFISLLENSDTPRTATTAAAEEVKAPIAS